MTPTKQKILGVLSLILCLTSCNCGAKLEEYLFRKGKAVAGYCNINSVRYEDSKIYDPEFHSQHPHYTTLGRTMFIDPERYVFSYALLSDPKDEIPEFKYRLYFYLPCEYNGWNNQRTYSITEDNRWEYKMPFDFNVMNVEQLVKELRRKDQLGVAILRNNATGEEVCLSGTLEVVQDKQYLEYYCIKYQLKGKWRTGGILQVVGESNNSVDLRAWHGKNK